MPNTNGQGRDFEGQVKPSAIEVDAYERDLFAHRHMTIETNQQGRWEYDGNGNVLYAGYAPRGLAANQTGWLLQKFSYTSGMVTLRQIAYDTWNNRSGATYL